jgi:hypothetical protein
LERFTSEYELYCQDVASGAIKDADSNGTPDDMDAAQGRVFNVTGVVTRSDITALESTGLNGKQINRDTKYPVDAATMQAVVENYTKTSSATFEPKQSDMHYWYSPDCGVVVFAEPDADIETDLNSQIQSGQDAKGNPLGASTQWIDLTLGVFLSGDGGSLDLSTVNTDLATNTWEDVQKIAKANKTAEAGWSVGDTKSVEINGIEYDATIIGINHEGVNGITFMIMRSDGIGYHVMNTDYTNAGGWEASAMRAWLNGDIYNSMSNNDYIKPVSKMTNNTGYQGATATSTSDKVFLLSPKEAGVADDITNDDWWDWYPEEYKPVFETEGATYSWFISNTFVDWFWLRSPLSHCDGYFSGYFGGSMNDCGANLECTVCPAFVIG